jgi:hypothetical protein
MMQIVLQTGALGVFVGPMTLLPAVVLILACVLAKGGRVDKSYVRPLRFGWWAKRQPA